MRWRCWYMYDKCLYSLGTRVQEQLNQGWSIKGPPVVAREWFSTTYIQLLVKDDPNR